MKPWFNKSPDMGHQRNITDQNFASNATTREFPPSVGEENQIIASEEVATQIFDCVFVRTSNGVTTADLMDNEPDQMLSRVQLIIGENEKQHETSNFWWSTALNASINYITEMTF